MRVSGEPGAVADAARPAAPEGRQAAMAFIMIAVLIDMLAIGVIVPVLPALVGSLTGSQADQALWLGVVAFAFGFSNFFASPLLGALSDSFGRRPVLLIGFCGLAISFFATALSTTMAMLVVVRMIGGGMQANIAVANAYVADISAPDERAKRFGLLGAMFGVGFILGPAMGGVLGAIDLHLPFFAAGSLALLNVLYGWFVLPESLPQASRKRFAWKAANPIAALRRLSALKGIGRLVGVIACTGLAQGILYTTWVLYTTFKFGWTTADNGWSLAAVGVMSVIVQGWLLGKLLKHMSAQRLAVIGLVSATFAFAMWGAAPAGWFMYLVIVANIFGYTVTAAMQSIVSSAADASSQGETMGAVSSMNSLTAVIAPLIGAPLLGAVSHLPQGHWAIGTPLYFGAMLQALALLLAWTHFRNRRRQRRAEAAVAAPSAT
ncbi:MFS transporter [Piscinibacter sakaiensis]|uniref:MFS transporter n=1 Tax=Piscinibacter sakaiensis TaxID=1547922 RepID=UPI003AAE3D0F